MLYLPYSNIKQFEGINSILYQLLKSYDNNIAGDTCCAVVQTLGLGVNNLIRINGYKIHRAF